MLKFVVSFVCVFVLSANAYAWKETGGGDEVALEFQQAFFSALRAVEEGKVSGKFSAEGLKAAARKAQIVVVEKPLLVKAPGGTQESIAVNTPASFLIQVNRSRWNAIRDVKIKEAVALHEVLSLMGLEHTGYYEYSARYLEAAGLSPWLVSGNGKGRVEKPAPKTLNCKVSYFPANGSYADVEELTVSIATKELNSKGPWSLRAEQTLTTKDKSFNVKVWAMQPFRTAYNPAAYEYVGLMIEDRKAGSSSATGPTFPADAPQNLPYAKAGYLSSEYANVTAECSLQ